MTSPNYIGCYNDGGSTDNKDGNLRGLPHYRGNVNTINECQDLALQNGDILFGLQYGGQCFTGSDILSATQWGEAKNNANCNPVLGGSWVNQLYSNDKRPPTFIGCFKDTSNRAIPHLRQDSGATVHSCHLQAIQNGDTIFGVQDNKCYTGNDIMSATKYGKSDQCSGAFVNELYSINPDSISNNIANQYQQQINTLQQELGSVDSSYISMNMNWMTNYNQLQSQLSNTLTQLSNTQMNDSSIITDLSNAETNLSNTLNVIARANNDIATNFINSKDNFSNQSIMKEGFDTVANYENNIQNLNSIVQSEQERLQQKKKSVDDAFFTQNRMIELNESLRKRYAAFNFITITFVISFILIFMVILLGRYVPFVPVGFICSLIFLVACLVAFVKYYNISSRWNMDYDVYNLNPPVLHNGPTPTPLPLDASGNPIQSAASLPFCVGPKCCSSGTFWNQLQNICTTTQQVQGFRNRDASEFENYSMV
jgi:hypothetical protein